MVSLPGGAQRAMAGDPVRTGATSVLARMTRTAAIFFKVCSLDESNPSEIPPVSGVPEARRWQVSCPTPLRVTSTPLSREGLGSHGCAPTRSLHGAQGIHAGVSQVLPEGVTR